MWRRLPHGGGGIVLLSFEATYSEGGRLFQSGRGGHPAYALHWDVHDAAREASASRRTALFPERENGRRLIGKFAGSAIPA
jgi:hypothetical protein